MRRPRLSGGGQQGRGQGLPAGRVPGHKLQCGPDRTREDRRGAENPRPPRKRIGQMPERAGHEGRASAHDRRRWPTTRGSFTTTSTTASRTFSGCYDVHWGAKKGASCLFGRTQTIRRPGWSTRPAPEPRRHCLWLEDLDTGDVGVRRGGEVCRSARRGASASSWPSNRTQLPVP